MRLRRSRAPKIPKVFMLTHVLGGGDPLPPLHPNTCVSMKNLRILGAREKFKISAPRKPLGHAEIFISRRKSGYDMCCIVIMIRDDVIYNRWYMIFYMWLDV